MNQHCFKICVIVLFFLLPLSTTKSDCGIGGRASKNYSFIHSDIIPYSSDYTPYLIGYGIIDNYLSLKRGGEKIGDDENVNEWRGRLCDIAKPEDVAFVIYKSTLDELADLRSAITSKDKEAFYLLRDNSFASTLKNNSCIETVDYLIYAKQCEKYTVKPFSISDFRFQPGIVKSKIENRKSKIENPDQAEMVRLINYGRQAFRTCNAPFLKLRYAYQMIRLAHYLKDYETVLELYNELTPKLIKVNSIINYWILAHKAGALKSLGHRAEAAHLFAVVFHYCKSKRQQAFISFDVRTEQEWQDCSKLCRDNKERAALYAIRAGSDKAHALEDMKSLYALDPKSDFLDMLLIRETLRLEKVLLGYDFRRQRYPTETINASLNYLNRFLQFVHQVAEERKTDLPALWKTTEGYLYILAGDREQGVKLLNLAQNRTKDVALLQQIDAFKTMAEISEVQNTDDSIVHDLHNYRMTIPFKNNPEVFMNYFYERVGYLYRRKKETGAAFLSEFTLRDLQLNPQEEIIDSVLSLSIKLNKTNFEHTLTIKNDTGSITSDIWDIKGRLHLSRFHFDAAEEAFSHIPVGERDTSERFLPFTEKIKDCINCAVTSGGFTRYEFAQKMNDLERTVKFGGIANAAEIYFQLGLGYYNMSFFGNSSGLVDFKRNGSTWKYLNTGKNIFQEKNRPYGNFEMLNMSMALNAFEQARLSAHNKTPNLAAQCAFWCAKCDQNLFYMSADNHYTIGSKLIPDLPPQYRRYFKLLRENYYSTAYFQKARTECRYFDMYVRH